MENRQAAVGHREWKIAKIVAKEEVKKEEKAVKLTKHEIKKLHKMFIDLMKIIKRSDHVSLPEDLTTPQEKEEFKDVVTYYLLELYKFARAYERILRQLWEKERILLRKIKKS